MIRVRSTVSSALPAVLAKPWAQCATICGANSTPKQRHQPHDEEQALAKVNGRRWAAAAPSCVRRRRAETRPTAPLGRKRSRKGSAKAEGHGRHRRKNPPSSAAKTCSRTRPQHARDQRRQGQPQRRAGQSLRRGSRGRRDRGWRGRLGHAGHSTVPRNAAPILALTPSLSRRYGRAPRS